MVWIKRPGDSRASASCKFPIVHCSLCQSLHYWISYRSLRIWRGRWSGLSDQVGLAASTKLGGSTDPHVISRLEINF